MATISLIKQKDKTGCGIACVAMIANRSYEEMKDAFAEILNWSTRREEYYTLAKDLGKALKKYGIRAKEKKSGCWDDIQGTAIVGVNRRKKHFHWVVVVKDNHRFLILDPEKNEVRCGKRWADKRNGYSHSQKSTTYLSIPINATRIRI
ncbi:hypothetical protein F8A87_08310 [Betaproteobacteria bacterium SCN2]|jgi:ABC-type bacteriocin/lantibiotic exporter with double-glycine peptidase domain|nr:hypothetical protein F8A87_08310 [Betaproteobacteria bacterium SCN2]